MTLILMALSLLLLSAGGPGQALAHYEPTGIREVDRAVARWSLSTLCPAHFKDKDGNVRKADLALACVVLWELGVPVSRNLSEVFVVRASVGFTGKLLSALGRRVGWDLGMVEETATTSTWRIRNLRDCGAQPCPDDECRHWRPSRTTTMDMAKQAGWTRRKREDLPSAYETMPERMLGWRSMTWLIDHYAPGVRLGIEEWTPQAQARGATLDFGVEPGAVEGNPPPPPALGSAPDHPPVEVYDRAPEARGYMPDEEPF